MDRDLTYRERYNSSLEKSRRLSKEVNKNEFKMFYGGTNRVLLFVIMLVGVATSIYNDNQTNDIRGLTILASFGLVYGLIIGYRLIVNTHKYRYANKMNMVVTDCFMWDELDTITKSIKVLEDLNSNKESVYEMLRELKNKKNDLIGKLSKAESAYNRFREDGDVE